MASTVGIDMCKDTFSGTVTRICLTMNTIVILEKWWFLPRLSAWRALLVGETNDDEEDSGHEIHVLSTISIKMITTTIMSFWNQLE